MSRYTINLNENNSSQKTHIWIFLGVFFISLILIFSISHFLKNKKNRKSVVAKTIVKKSTEMNLSKKIETPETQKKVIKPSPQKVKKSFVKPKPKVKPKRYVRKTKVKVKKSNPIKNILFKNEIDGYSISGVALAKGISPTVFMKKNGATKTYHIGDKVGENKIKEIHRTYILLVNDSRIIHLNYLR